MIVHIDVYDAEIDEIFRQQPDIFPSHRVPNNWQPVGYSPLKWVCNSCHHKNITYTKHNCSSRLFEGEKCSKCNSPAI